MAIKIQGTTIVDNNQGLRITGVSTFTTTAGPVLIGGGTSTGTAGQVLQVTGINSSVYIGGSVGIGTTNPGAKLDVAGDIRLSAADAEIEFNTGGARLKGRTNALSIHTGSGLDSEASEQVRINTTGVGIGTTNPTSQLHVLENLASGYAAIFDNDGNNANRFGIRIQCGVDTGAGTAIAIDDGDGTNQGNVTFNAGTVTYGAFTANHDCIIPSYSGEIPYGTLLSINEIVYKHKEDGTVLPRGIVYSVGIASTSYSKNLLGAYSYQYDSSSPAQQGVDDPVHQVLVLGDGHIRCCGENGNIKLGDGITSSSTEGVGMKMDKIGVVIGIAQEDVDFVSPIEVKLVAVQYGLHQYIPDNIAEYIENLMNT